MAAGADLSGGLEPVAVRLWPPGEAPPVFQYSPDNVAGADGDIDPTEITFPGCSCLTSSCVVHMCSCLCRGENYNSSCLKPTDKEEDFLYDKAALNLYLSEGMNLNAGTQKGHVITMRNATENCTGE
ncbi:histone-lysine N-methyltransferase SETMAR [Grus japonensis]|uniref:Histone-lysine N-methyltransferase SETMAR n=1 Tax=Grus japonensis TaxID=30415 RepID=A0ABC9X9V0_GRUJA